MKKQDWRPAWLNGFESPVGLATPLVAVQPEPAAERAAEGPSEPPAAAWWRQRLPEWPNAWRREWGERANALQDLGVDWRSAEERAFRETALAHGEDEWS